ncbi:uncharacterized protein METZ01_LOCUS350283, partial [marine metagenome]
RFVYALEIGDVYSAHAKHQTKGYIT